MDIDIQLYVKKLKDFFNRDEQAKKDMFGTANVDMGKFYIMVAQQAVINHKEIGDPTLSPPQLMEIMAELAINDVVEELDLPARLYFQDKDIAKVFSKPVTGFPPFCLN